MASRREIKPLFIEQFQTGIHPVGEAGSALSAGTDRHTDFQYWPFGKCIPQGRHSPANQPMRRWPWCTFHPGWSERYHQWHSPRCSGILFRFLLTRLVQFAFGNFKDKIFIDFFQLLRSFPYLFFKGIVGVLQYLFGFSQVFSAVALGSWLDPLLKGLLTFSAASTGCSSF